MSEFADRDQLSAHETSFFRHRQQIDVFQQLVSTLIADRQAQEDQSLRIWSAACATSIRTCRTP